MVNAQPNLSFDFVTCHDLFHYDWSKEEHEKDPEHLMLNIHWLQSRQAVKGGEGGRRGRGKGG